MSIKSLVERDREVIWHPFTQHGLSPEFLPVKTAKGAWFTLEDGRQLLDASSSWWVNIHGHAHPVIAEAIYEQAMQLEHAIFANLTHEPAVKLAEQLLAACQQRGVNLARCFYSDNGSTAVEVALKMAFQYHKNRGVNSRTRFIALTNSYHGDTLGSMAVSERRGFHQQFSELMPQVDYIDVGDIAALKLLLNTHPKQHAAIIIEPMIQAAGGMRLHDASFLQALEIVCHENELLLICDEVFTGFYRTGKCFAFEHAKIKPDFICLSKGITGGYLPLGVTLTSEMIFAEFYSQDVHQAFFHSHSYTANPIACAAALASWNLLQSPETQAAIERIVARTKEWVLKLSESPGFINARSLGTIGAVDISHLPGYFSGIGHKITALAVKHGVLLRPLGPVLYTLPPYCITGNELDQIYETMITIVNELEVSK